jgi:hypothetical protein
MGQAATFDATATVPNAPVPDAVDYLTKLLKQQTVHDVASGQTIPAPLEKVELSQGLNRSADGAVKESLSVVLTLSDAGKLDQSQMLERADAVLRTVPILAEHFSFGADPVTPEKPRPVAHVRHADNQDKLIVTFHLPQGLESAKVLANIEEMKNLASNSAPAVIESASIAPVQPNASVPEIKADEPAQITGAAPILTPNRPIVGSGSFTSGLSQPLAPAGRSL